jgi:DNA-binding GntR family transcriptional regulator
MTASVPSSQAQTAYAELRRLLLAGTFAPGEQLAETTLAERLGVSRTPVREALRRLESDGLVATSWRGVRVPVADEAELAHAYELRAALEALSCELAARRVAGGRLPPSDLERLREAARAAQEETAAGRLDRAIERNRDFHRHLAVMAGNPLVLEALDRLWNRLLVSTRASLLPHDRAAAVAREHDALVDAVAAGRSADAAEAARSHVLATRSALR